MVKLKITLGRMQYDRNFINAISRLKLCKPIISSRANKSESLAHPGGHPLLMSLQVLSEVSFELGDVDTSKISALELRIFPAFETFVFVKRLYVSV